VSEWKTPAHVDRYRRRAEEHPRRAEGESVLLEQIAREAARILDLGTGDGRLLALLQDDRRDMRGVGVDFSELMLAAARERFAGDERIELIRHDLTEPLPALGRFDAVVSSMAIHHLEHERKRSLYGEVFALLEPGGVFANFEHVASPTRRLHLAFSPRSTSRSSTRTRPIACSTSRPSSRGCASSDTTTSTAIGNGSKWRCSSASNLPKRPSPGDDRRAPVAPVSCRDVGRCRDSRDARI
jgi:SAM-dependent methyltransferase